MKPKNGRGPKGMSADKARKIFTDPRVARVVAEEHGVSTSTVLSVRNRSRHKQATDHLPDHPRSQTPKDKK